MANEEFKGLPPVETSGVQPSPTERDFPVGTTARFTLKKYLWAVTGAVGLDLPVGTWEDIEYLVEDWVDFQANLVEKYKEKLNAVYAREAPSKSRSSSGRSKEGGGSALSAVRSKMFALATQKGVHVKAKYPDFMDWDIRGIEDFMEELEAMPDKGQDAGETATSRVRRARSSRRG